MTHNPKRLSYQRIRNIAVIRTLKKSQSTEPRAHSTIMVFEMNSTRQWSTAAFTSAAPVALPARVSCTRTARTNVRSTTTPRRRHRRHARVCATAGGDDADVSEARRALEKLFKQSPSSGPPAPNGEPLSLGEIRDGGMQRIERAADDLKGELADIEAATEQYAEQLVDEEMGKVLKKYEAQRESLLLKQKEQVEGIRKEALLLQELAGSAQNAVSSKDEFDPRRKSLLSVAGMFAVAAMIYFWNGITNDSPTNLSNAAVDAVFAAMIAYLSVDRSKGKDVTESVEGEE